LRSAGEAIAAHSANPAFAVARPWVGYFGDSGERARLFFHQIFMGESRFCLSCRLFKAIFGISEIAVLALLCVYCRLSKL